MRVLPNFKYQDNCTKTTTRRGQFTSNSNVYFGSIKYNSYRSLDLEEQLSSFARTMKFASDRVSSTLRYLTALFRRQKSTDAVNRITDESI